MIKFSDKEFPDEDIQVKYSDMKIKRFPEINENNIEMTAKLTDSGSRLFKKLLKLPRKKKKILGTVKAKKRLLKRVNLGLPINKIDLKRAGVSEIKEY